MDSQSSMAMETAKAPPLDADLDRPGPTPVPEAPLGAARRPRFWRELVFVVTFYLLYELASDLSSGARSEALSHALAEVHLERSLGIFWEQRIQHVVLAQVWLVKASDLFYATVHFVLPVVVLAWLFWRVPARYRRWRNAMAWLMGVSLVVFVVDPVMPPRMLPASFQFVDTMKVVGGAGRLDSVLLKSVGNLYAAMPSLHVAWAGWCAAALVPAVRRRWLKVLLAFDPVVTAFVVIITANHFFLDVAAGGAVLLVGIGLAHVPWPAVLRAGRLRAQAMVNGASRGPGRPAG